MTRGGLNRREAFAARATAAGKRGAAAFGGLAGKKPVLAFAADFRRLILAFHKFYKMVPGAKTGVCENSNKTSRVKARFRALLFRFAFSARASAGFNAYLQGRVEAAAMPRSTCWDASFAAVGHGLRPDTPRFLVLRRHPVGVHASACSRPKQPKG